MLYPPAGSGPKGPLRLHGSVYDMRIHKQQQEEARKTELCASAQEAHWLQLHSEVCERSDKLAKAANVRHRAEELRKIYVSTLSRRRDALQELLAAEEKEYQTQLQALEIQPEQRREKLMEKARQIRKKNEEEKKRLEDELRLKCWSQSCDELKSADSKLHALQTVALRDEQLIEKAKQRMEEKSSEKLFDALWFEEYRKKVQKEAEDQQRRANEKLITKAALLQQLSLREEQRRQEKEDLHVEHLQQRQREAERSTEARKEWAAEQLRSLQKRQELSEAIDEQRERKEFLRKQKQEEDRNYLQAEKEEVLRQEQEELKKRESVRQFAVGYKEALRSEMRQKAQDLRETDQLYLQEQEKEWQKREVQWKREDEGRSRLMQEVQQSRNALCRRKSLEREAEKKEKEQYMNRLKQDALAFREEILTRKRESEIVKRTYRDELRQQLENLKAQRLKEKEQEAVEHKGRLHTEKQVEEAQKTELDRRSQLLQAMAHTRQKLRETRAHDLRAGVAKEETRPGLGSNLEGGKNAPPNH